MRTRRQTVELIGLNNGRIVCRATKLSAGWLCDLVLYAVGHTDQEHAATMREAETVLRDLGGANKVLRCSELPSAA